MMNRFLCGIEFEYLLIDADGNRPGQTSPGRIRDFGNLAYPEIAAILGEPPGLDDVRLATGDLGIKRGYWYLEGDERFHPDGRFRTLAVKGVEIRTPPGSIPEAIADLQRIETELAARLATRGLALAIAAANPERAAYTFSPPLNAWEIALRQEHRAYDAAHIATLSYGPDINLSLPGQDPSAALAMAQKLAHYAPWLVPFSLCSPFHAGARWPGVSWRTFHRAPLRPAVKLFIDPEDYRRQQEAIRDGNPNGKPNDFRRNSRNGVLDDCCIAPENCRQQEAIRGSKQNGNPNGKPNDFWRNSQNGVLDDSPGAFPPSVLLYPARQASEIGRIEFKAFDAQPSLEVLAALCHLLIGICLAKLPGRDETPNLPLYRRAAQRAFHDKTIHTGSRMLLDRARAALTHAGYPQDALTPLYCLHATRTTPAHWLLAHWQTTGAMTFPGGLGTQLWKPAESATWAMPMTPFA
jgi:hypothetical protein